MSRFAYNWGDKHCLTGRGKGSLRGSNIPRGCYPAVCGIRLKMEAGCWLREILKAGCGMRDENGTARPGYAPFRRRDKG